MKSVAVVELFGPTIQGEGPYAGQRSTFIRFGGCDYRCSWCDSLHAVIPEQYRGAPRLNEHEILERIHKLGVDPGIIVFSGGNPAIHDLTDLVDLLATENLKVQVETQGTLLPRWLHSVMSIVVSPKPPSSGMNQSLEETKAFFNTFVAGQVAVKIVVFDNADLDYVESVIRELHPRRLFLSVGTGATEGPLEVIARYKWLVETSLERFGQYPRTKIIVLPQLHFLMWGHQKGH